METLDRRAQERADREGADADGAQKDDGSAAGRVRDAQKVASPDRAPAGIQAGG